MNHYVLALDQGTTSSRAILFNRKGEIKALAQKEFPQYFPQSGWVEHNPNEIWSSQASVIAEALSEVGVSHEKIEAIGIANQRETTLVWERTTGNPLYNAIVWQDRRTAAFCDQIKQEGFAPLIREKTGLIPDAYFSGTKIKWILDHVPGAREKAKKGALAFGTVDSWLIWKLTQGRKHVTDVSNASRTLLFNIHTLEWDQDLLDLFDIPRSMMPEVVASSGIAGLSENQFGLSGIPISGLAGDQQAALFGQLCLEPGMAKNTYGTGCFLLKNTGDKPFTSQHNLLTTIAWKIDNKITYALEGSVFIGGAAVQWLRDGLRIITSSSESESLARSVEDNGGVYFVPAFTGLGAPYWDPDVRGTLFGLSRGTRQGHIARATLEGIAFQSAEVLNAMFADDGVAIKEVRVDGSAAANNLLMQSQADLLQTKVVRPKNLEITALGAAWLAGLGTRFWDHTEELQNQWQKEAEFNPQVSEQEASEKIKRWQKAVRTARIWGHPE